MATSEKKNYGYNPKPKLSANQLAEYLIATPARGKTILKDAKFPRTVLVARYRTAKRALQKHLLDKTRSHHFLSDAIQALISRRNTTGVSKWTMGDANLSIEAIKNYQKTSNTLGLSGINFTTVTSKFGPIEYNGVTIPVALDLICHRVSRSGQKYVGGLIFVFSKGDAAKRHRESRCNTAAYLILETAERFLSQFGTPDPELCIVVDLFNGKVHQATGARKNTIRQIEAACTDISVIWPTIKPPPGYDGPPVP